MTRAEELIEKLVNFNWWVIPKAGIIFLLFFPVLFGFLVLRQIQLMSRVVSGINNAPLRVLGWLGVGLSVLVLLLAILVL